jgi:hypothetical protein
MSSNDQSQPATGSQKIGLENLVENQPSQLQFLSRLFGNSSKQIINDAELSTALYALASPDTIKQLFEVIDQQLKQQNAKLNQYVLAPNLLQSIANADQAFASSLPKELKACLEIINQLFSYTSQNKYLSVECKTIIGHLRLSFCKLVLTDSSLLLDTMHPARQFFNLLIKVSLLWNNDDPKTKQILLQVETAVKNVITFACQNDIKDAFTSAYNQLESFSASLFKRIEIFEKRIYEAEQGKAKADYAKQQARQQLVVLTAQLDIPAFVVKFFHTAWEHILFLEQLKAQSNHNSEALFAAKKLLVSLYPKQDFDSQAKLETLILELKPYLEQKLNHTCYSQEQAASFLHQLNQHQQKTLVQTKLNVESSSKETIIRLKPNQPLSFDDEAESIETETDDIENMSIQQWVEFDYQQLIVKSNTDKSIEKSTVKTIDKADGKSTQTPELEALQKQLKINQLFEIKQANDWQLSKLIGHIELTNHYIFVDLSGNKLAQLSQTELLNQSQNKQLQPYDKQAEFDKALNRVQLETYESDLRLKQKQQTQINIEAELKRIEEVKKAKQAQIEAEQAKIRAEHETRLSQKIKQTQLQDISQLAIGSRVDLTLDNNVKPCRLAAKIASSGKYIFVDRSGVKVKQCNAAELEQLFALGQIKLRHQLEVNDDALASVISRARRSKI